MDDTIDKKQSIANVFISKLNFYHVIIAILILFIITWTLYYKAKVKKMDKDSDTKKKKSNYKESLEKKIKQLNDVQSNV